MGLAAVKEPENEPNDWFEPRGLSPVRVYLAAQGFADHVAEAIGENRRDSKSV